MGEVVLFAYEEAIGFMCGTKVLDKDGVSASVVVTELIRPGLDTLQEMKRKEDIRFERKIAEQNLKFFILSFCSLVIFDSKRLYFDPQSPHFIVKYSLVYQIP